MNPRALMLPALVSVLALAFIPSTALAEGPDPTYVAFVTAIIAIPIVGRVILCLWIYSDGSRRGISVAGWIIVALINPLIGLILYHSERHRLRPDYYPYQYSYPPYGYHPPPYQYDPTPTYPAGEFRPSTSCLYCRAQIPLGLRFCPFCGARQR